MKNKSIKTIRKPKFLVYYLCTLAVLIPVTVCITYGLLESKAADVRTELSEDFDKYLSYLVDDVRKFSQNESDPDLLRSLNYRIALAQLHDSYVSVYLGDKKMADTNDFRGIGIIVKQKDSSMEYYYIEDMRYFAPIKKYFGEQAFEDYMRKEYEYRNDEMGRMYLVDSDYLGSALDPVDVYLNTETHRFLPGIVESTGLRPIPGSKIEHTEGVTTVRIDCTPSDTEGYTHVERSSAKCWIPFLFNENVWFEETVLEESNCNAVVAEYDEGTHYIENANGVEKPCKWLIKYVQPEPEPIMKLLPYTIRVCCVVALVAHILMALVISLVAYLRAKTVWEIFDYRKRTTEAMAHDLKTPLHSISLYAETLEDMCQGKEEEKYSAKIRDTVQEMNTMVEGILNFSRSEGTNRQVVRKETDICQMLKDCIERYTPVLASRNIQFEFKESPCNIKTDPILISQCIDNLMSNCSRYADPDSTITAEVTSDSVSFKNRTSQDLDDVEKLKQPFVKGSAARNKGGSGLGLSIVDNNLSVLGHKLELDLADHIFTARIRF